MSSSSPFRLVQTYREIDGSWLLKNKLASGSQSCSCRRRTLGFARLYAASRARYTMHMGEYQGNRLPELAPNSGRLQSGKGSGYLM